jgi:uncharacterized protein YjbI with pentapeptide repeats
MALRFLEDPLYQLLRDEKVKAFNEQKSKQSDLIDFHDCDFRGLDLRGLDATNINFSGCYFRGADLRGIDFSQTDLDGASIASAKISGCLFAKNISATEVIASVEHGIRMRVRD